MSEIKHTPITDDTFILGYKVGAGLHGTREDAEKAIRRGEGSSWIPLYRKNHAGAELLGALVKQQNELAALLLNLQFKSTGRDPKNNGYAYAELPDWQIRQLIEGIESVLAKTTAA